MMIYYYPVDFDFVNKYVESVKNYGLNVKKIDLNSIQNVVSFNCTPYGNIKKLIEDELISKGFPAISYAVSYVRGPDDVQNVHVDGHDELIHAALNLPIMGCAGSYHTWLAADFELEKDAIYYKPRWKDNVVAIENLQITRPYFVRVDQPHFTTGNGVEPRWTISLRFQGNPTIEELIEIYKKL